MTKTNEENLKIVEKKILRTIQRTARTAENKYRLIIIEAQNIFRKKKQQRMKWLEHPIQLLMNWKIAERRTKADRDQNV